jgi:hypothetical protein
MFRSPRIERAVKYAIAFTRLAHVYEKPSVSHWPKLSVFDQLSDDQIQTVQRGWKSLKLLSFKDASGDPVYVRYLIGNGINEDDFNDVIRDVRFTGVKKYAPDIKRSIWVTKKILDLAESTGNSKDADNLRNIIEALSIRLSEAEHEGEAPVIVEPEIEPFQLDPDDMPPETLRVRVAKRADVFNLIYKRAQDLTGSTITTQTLSQTPVTPTTPNTTQTLTPESLLQAKNTAIFLVRNTPPLGPLEWLEKYTVSQVKQAQANKVTNPVVIATPEALNAAKNLKMAARNLVLAMENKTFSLPAAKSALAIVNTQFKDFDNKYLKSWITQPQYAAPKDEGKQYRAITDALKILGNLLK